MKLIFQKPNTARKQNGWALMIVMMLGMGAILMAGAVLRWSTMTADTTARNNEFYATTYAAEAATEKVMSGIVSDYENYGEPVVYSRLSTYSNYYPTATDDPYWGSYIYSSSAGKTNSVSISRINPTNIVLLGPPYQGLYMLAATYEICSTAMNTTTDFHINTCVGQQVNLGTIPIFQFAIFFENTLEIDPGANLTVNGFVHGNNNVFIDSTATVIFSNDVSGSGTINISENPLDPSSRGTPNNPTFDGYHLSGVNPLVLPVGTNSSGSITNSSANVNAILQIPPAGVSPTSFTGSNYLYNRADMIVLISNSSVTVTSGVNVDNRATTISNAAWNLWLNTNSSAQFYDQRQGITIQTADLDVGMLRQWSATNTTLRTALGGRDLDSVFIADERANSNAVITTNISYSTNQAATNTTPFLTYPTLPFTNYFPPVTTNWVYVTNSARPTNGTYLGSVTSNSSPSRYAYELIVGYSYQKITGIVTNTTYSTNWNVTSQAGVVITNGAQLPTLGLAVVTPDPAYIVGNYNVTTNGTPVNLGTFNTSQTYPAAVYSDAITVLSSKWNPTHGAMSIANRGASNDTVNAAFLTGNVPSNGSYYSGGVENFPRFLEDWSVNGGCTFTYNGSMVCMFTSQIATAPWPGTGTVYNPPTRNWAFDLNFNNALKQPPLTPHVISVNRAVWTFLDANTTTF